MTACPCSTSSGGTPTWPRARGSDGPRAARRRQAGTDAVGRRWTGGALLGRRHHRRLRRAARGRRRPRRRRARHLRHDAHHLGGDPRLDRGPRALDHPAHRPGQDPDRRAEQRRRPVPRLGPALAGRVRRRRRTAPTRAGSRCGPRTCGASARRCTTPTAGRACTTSTSPHGPAAVRRAALRGVRLRRAPPPRPAPALVAPGASSPPAAACGSTAWVQALADCTGLPVDVVAVPEGGALGAAFLARVTAGLEAARHGRRRPLGAGRPPGRARRPLGGGRRRPLPPVPGANLTPVSDRSAMTDAGTFETFDSWASSPTRWPATCATPIPGWPCKRRTTPVEPTCGSGFDGERRRRLRVYRYDDVARCSATTSPSPRPPSATSWPW